MTSPIGEPNKPYSDVRIPDLDEAADIRAALRIYHYGSNVSDPYETPDAEDKFQDSLAKNLLDLNDNKRNKSIVTIPADTNLNNIVDPGVYYIPTSNLTGGSNYPLIDGTKRAGFLFVESTGSGATVFQKYVTVDTNSSLNGIVFVRTKVSVTVGGNTQSTWAPPVWSRLSDSAHNHDERYMQLELLNPELQQRPTQVNGKNSSGTTLSGTRKIVVAAPMEVSGVQVPNITTAQQTSLQPGDLWFW